MPAPNQQGITNGAAGFRTQARGLAEAVVPGAVEKTVDVRAPWSLALATHLKLFPALAALWWVGRRDWRALAKFGGWVAGLGLLQLVLEPRSTAAFPAFLLTDQVGQVNSVSPYVISPWLWAALVLIGLVAAIRWAPRRWGWAIAIALSVFANPRLLVYQVSTLAAGLRAPNDPDR